MAYISLYRKYRSQTFGDLIGQDHIVRTLQNGIASGRISHAYLFTGPRGTGKTSSARVLAKCLCCEKGPTPEPCNECEICISITEGSCIDVVEMDAASQTGIDDVREKIIQVTEYMPAICRYKVFVIDEVHEFSSKAFDALLKTIEEPPAHMIFVLATTEFNKVPPTVRSRCQKFEFHRGSIQDLIQRLEYVAKSEKVEVAPQALYAIARMADGGFRDALTFLEQAIIGSPSASISLQDVYNQLGLVPEETTDRILDGIVSGDISELTDVLDELTRIGRDPISILDSLMYRIADLTRIVYHVEKGHAADSAHAAASHDLAVRMGQSKLLAVRGAISEAHKNIRDVSLPRLWLESELIRISQFGIGAEIKTIPVTAEKRAEATAANGERTSEPKVVEPAGDPTLDKGGAIWDSILSALPQKSGQRSTIYLKLSGSRVVSFDGQSLVIEHGKMSIEWLLDPKVPGRHGMLLQEAEKLGFGGIKMEFRVSKHGKRESEPAAVELPAEGPKLAEMARDVFGS